MSTIDEQIEQLKQVKQILSVPRKDEYLDLIPKKDYNEYLFKLFKPHVYEEIGIILRKSASYGSYYIKIEFKKNLDFMSKINKIIQTHRKFNNSLYPKRIELNDILEDIMKQFLIDFSDDYVLVEYMNLVNTEPYFLLKLKNIKH